MVRPVTATEVLLQQIAGTLERIEGQLLQQNRQSVAKQDNGEGPVEVRGQADKADADTPPAAPKKSPRRGKGRGTGTSTVSGK